MFYNKYNFRIKDFTGDSPARPEIAGILMKPKESVATDSFMLIKVDSVKADCDSFPKSPDGKSPKKEFEEFILPKKSAENVLKLFSSEGSTILPIINNAVITKKTKNGVEIGKTDLETFNLVNSRTIQGKFPAYNDLFQEKGKYVEICVSPKFLRKIATFYSEFCDNPIAGLTIRVPVKPNGIVRFQGKRKETGQKADILLMPIKSE